MTKDKWAMVIIFAMVLLFWTLIIAMVVAAD
jgi:hypothetical protein